MNIAAKRASRVQRLRAVVRRLLADESGASLPLVAAVLIPVMGFVGLVTDAGRGYLVKARLADALDAAVLAGAQVTDLTALQSEIQRFFDANFPPGYMGATATLNPAQVSADEEVISVSATAEVDTAFMELFGHRSLTVAAATEVTRRTISMDIALSIDMSSSMAWFDGAGSTRIAAARTAAHSLVDLIYGSHTTKEGVLIGLVPWNGAVNATLNGTAYDPALVTAVPTPVFTDPLTGAARSETYLAANSPVPLLRAPPAGWTGCVYARYLDTSTNDDDADHLLGPISTVDGTEWLGWMDSGKDYDDCLTNGITPLTEQRTTIEAAIDQLAWPRGVTDIAQGLAWAWRVVSPDAPFDQADPFPEGLHERAIVLLTDGEQWGGEFDGYNAVFGTGSSAGTDGMDDRLRAVAANVKAQGIKIYVIQFYHDSGPLQSLLQEVASEPQAPYYYFAADGDALNSVFREIAGSLEQLRVSQ